MSPLKIGNLFLRTRPGAILTPPVSAPVGCSALANGVEDAQPDARFVDLMCGAYATVAEWKLASEDPDGYLGAGYPYSFMTTNVGGGALSVLTGDAFNEQFAVQRELSTTVSMSQITGEQYSDAATVTGYSTWLRTRQRFTGDWNAGFVSVVGPGQRYINLQQIEPANRGGKGGVFLLLCAGDSNFARGLNLQFAQSATEFGVGYAKKLAEPELLWDDAGGAWLDLFTNHKRISSTVWHVRQTVMRADRVGGPLVDVVYERNGPWAERSDTGDDGIHGFGQGTCSSPVAGVYHGYNGYKLFLDGDDPFNLPAPPSPIAP